MDIIQQKSENTNKFWLHFYLNGEGFECFDVGLPHPQHHQHNIGQGFKVAWLLDGYFHTKSGQRYLNDTIARFLVTFKDLEPKRLAYAPTTKTKKILGHAYKLRELSVHLDSIKTRTKAPERADSYADYVFWAIKLFTEDEIRATGFIVYSTLEDWALNNFLENKEHSTIRAKCRSVWNYYEKKDFKLDEYKRKLTDEEYLMTRQENIKAINEKKTLNNKAKIAGAITTLEFMQEKINATNVAKYAGVSRPTVYKYKELWS